jgi:hypothetical protein
MEYGILVAESEDGNYQLIGAVDSIADAKEMALAYGRNDPDADCLPPDYFEIHRRDQRGAYTIVEKYDW